MTAAHAVLKVAVTSRAMHVFERGCDAYSIADLSEYKVLFRGSVLGNSVMTGIIALEVATQNFSKQGALTMVGLGVVAVTLTALKEEFLVFREFRDFGKHEEGLMQRLRQTKLGLSGSAEERQEFLRTVPLHGLEVVTFWPLIAPALEGARGKRTARKMRAHMETGNRFVDGMKWVPATRVAWELFPGMDCSALNSDWLWDEGREAEKLLSDAELGRLRVGLKEGEQE